ncbi:hypothetical protein D018_1416B, partial [Vibrio parahaemolyticus VP2007-007]
PNGHQVQ